MFCISNSNAGRIARFTEHSSTEWCGTGMVQFLDSAISYKTSFTVLTRHVEQKLWKSSAFCSPSSIIVCWDKQTHRKLQPLVLHDGQTLGHSESMDLWILITNLYTVHYIQLLRFAWESVCSWTHWVNRLRYFIILVSSQNPLFKHAHVKQQMASVHYLLLLLSVSLQKPWVCFHCHVKRIKQPRCADHKVQHHLEGIHIYAVVKDYSCNICEKSSGLSHNLHVDHYYSTCIINAR